MTIFSLNGTSSIVCITKSVNHKIPTGFKSSKFKPKTSLTKHDIILGQTTTAMAISLSRRTKALTKCIYTSLYCHFSHQTRPKPLNPLHLFPTPPLHRPFLPELGLCKDGTFNKFMCTSEMGMKQNLNSLGNGGETKKDLGSGNQENGGGSGSHQSNEKGKPIRGSPISWISLLLLVATGAGLVFYYDREKKKHIEEINTASNAVKQGPSVGKAAIGGPFNLIDHNGKSVTEKDFRGNWSILYFGFTHCPDICPDELQKLALAIDKIKEKSGIKLVPVFISVDPERDTVEQVGEYVKEFHPDLIGLTGSLDEIKKAARAYRVYYMKTEEEGSDYLVDHSIVMYLMDPDMEFVKFFGKNYDVDTLTDGVIKEIKQYKRAIA